MGDLRLPWTHENCGPCLGVQDRRIMDAGGRLVAKVWSSDEDADEIVRAMNATAWKAEVGRAILGQRTTRTEAFGVQHLASNMTTWYATQEEAWEAMGPGRRVVTR